MLCVNDSEKIYLQVKTQRGCAISKWCSYDLTLKLRPTCPYFLPDIPMKVVSGSQK